MKRPAHLSRCRRVRRAIVGAVATGCLAVVLAPGIASAGVLSTVAGILPNCGPTNASTPFAAWGDTNSYFLMPNGGLESGTAGWTVTNGSVVTGNESFHLNAATDTHSLSLAAGGSAVSPTACVAMGENTVRLLVKSSGVAGSKLHVQAYVQNALTGLVLSTGFDITGTTSWAPTPRLLIPNLLGGIAGTQNVHLVFTTIGRATWNIDDVFIDPLRHR